MTYEVYIKNKKVKEYPTKLQAIIYLFIKGYVYHCRCGKFIDDRCEIKELKDD